MANNSVIYNNKAVREYLKLFAPVHWDKVLQYAVMVGIKAILETEFDIHKVPVHQIEEALQKQIMLRNTSPTKSKTPKKKIHTKKKKSSPQSDSEQQDRAIRAHVKPSSRWRNGENISIRDALVVENEEETDEEMMQTIRDEQLRTAVREFEQMELEDVEDTENEEEEEERVEVAPKKEEKKKSATKAPKKQNKQQQQKKPQPTRKEEKQPIVVPSVREEGQLQSAQHPAQKRPAVAWAVGGGDPKPRQIFKPATPRRNRFISKHSRFQQARFGLPYDLNKVESKIKPQIEYDKKYKQKKNDIVIEQVAPKPQPPLHPQPANNTQKFDMFSSYATMQIVDRIFANPLMKDFLFNPNGG